VRILVACEREGRVREAFRARGHDAISCDLYPSTLPGPHYQGDVRDILRDGFDMLIGFPPCTDLAASGARWWKGKGQERADAALGFVMRLAGAPIPRIAIENPVGRISTLWRKPDQIIQPWMFGETYTKATCLWLLNLPPLFATCCRGERYPTIHRMSEGPERARLRSATPLGLAQAMADQWGNLEGGTNAR
jgi:hypothetical protein